MTDENTMTAGREPVCPPEAAPAESAGAPDVPVTASEAPALPALPAADGGTAAAPEGAPDGPARSPIWRTGVTSSLYVVDVGTVEGGKSAVRTLARRIAGVENSEATVPACAGVSFQTVTPFGAQWVMNCDLTPGTLYLVTYDAVQMAYTVDAYSPTCGVCIPQEHGYA